MYNVSNQMVNDNPFNPENLSLLSTVEDSPLDIAKLLLHNFYKKLFDVTLFYNYVLLLDTSLSVRAYHINHDLMLSQIKIYNGLNFGEPYMGKTSISESSKDNKMAVVYSGKNVNPHFRCYTNCTIPITIDNKTIGFLSSFFLSSKYDEIAINYFTLFANFINTNLKYYSKKNLLGYYVQKLIPPNFNISLLSDSEKRVLDYLKMGYSNKEISNSLFISENTTKSHVKVISEKLSCDNRTQIAINTLLFEIKELVADSWV